MWFSLNPRRMKFTEFISQKEIDDMLAWYENAPNLKFEGECKKEETQEGFILPFVLDFFEMKKKLLSFLKIPKIRD